MSRASEVLGFLDALAEGKTLPELPPAEVAHLRALGLVSFLDASEYAALGEEIRGIESARAAIERDGAERSRLAGVATEEFRATHSLLFHFHSAARRQDEEARAATDRAALQAEETALRADEERYAQLLARQSLYQALQPGAGGYLAITAAGSVALRDLTVRVYRVGPEEFSTYWSEAQQIDQELNAVADAAGALVTSLAGQLPGVDRSYLWAVAIGMAKRGGDPAARAATFEEAYRALRPLGGNEENRLMAAEILTVRERAPADSLPDLQALEAAVRSAGVPPEASLGVAAVLLLGQRQDGTFATANLPLFLKATPSYESAALLAVVNEPFADLASKFQAARAMFAGWGFAPSEDVALSAAYLTTSELPLEGVGPKLAIIVRGLAHYLQYPLAAAAILTSIPVMEANETLRLLESAYEQLGRRTGPLPPSELVCLAVRLIHGVRVTSVTALDPTAAAAPRVGYGPMVHPILVPLMVTQMFYYATFSGIGGAHPGHVHSFGGFTG